MDISAWQEPPAERALPRGEGSGNDPLSLLSEFAGMAERYLSESWAGTGPVVEHAPAGDLRARFAATLDRPLGPGPLLDAVGSALRYSVRTGHPRFFNQLYGGIDPAGILGEWLTAVLNTSMYTYEVAPVGTVLEQVLMERLGRFAGFPGGEGVFTPGGSVSNLMAALAARQHARPESKHRGNPPREQLVLLHSAEGHYSIPRAASIMGLGADSAIAVQTDTVGRMRPTALDLAITRARRAGQTPFMVVATAGTTVAGAFDPLEEIATVAKDHELWLHVDGSYGGSVLLSDRHRHLMAGVSRVDSITWNPHKMMGIPLTCSVLLTRETGLLAASNAMHADYLFHQTEDGVCDLGDRSLQCGRRADALKLWCSWMAHGDRGFAARVDRLFELAGIFQRALEGRPGFRLVRRPQGLNVCFRYLPPTGRSLGKAARLEMEHAATIAIRRALLAEGKFMLNCAPIDGLATFRIVLNNPEATPEDLEALLQSMDEIGRSV